MGNLKYLLPSDEGILQFLSYITEIWSRDQFFHENQLCFRSGVIFWWNKGCKRGKFLFLSDFLGVSYLQMAVIHSIFELGYWNFGNWKYSRATKTTLLCDFFYLLSEKSSYIFSVPCGKVKVLKKWYCLTVT